MRDIAITESVAAIAPSAAEETSFLANKLKREGIDIISFAQGEPDFDTPDNIKKAAIAALDEGFTKYTDVPGIPDLRKAIQSKLKRENAVEYEIEEILATSGGKSALYEIFRSLVGKGDDVLIPAPCYLSYEDQIKLTGARAVFFPTKPENGFCPTLQDVQQNITDNTRIFIVNTPCNPTGAVFKKKDLQEIANFLVERGVFILTDEVYEHLIYGENEHVSVASLSDEIKEMTITVNSVSKTYAMTGWRIGFVAGPKQLIRALNNLQGHAVGNPNSIAQRAAIEAYNGTQQHIEDRQKVYAERREYMVKRLNDMRDITCHSPEGAFYTYPNITSLYGKKYDGNKIENDLDVAKFLLEKAHVAVVPGVAFHGTDHIRFVFAKSMEEIKDGMDRVERAINELD